MEAVTGRMKRLWDGLWRKPPNRPTPNAECPVCGRPVVIAATGMAGGYLTGPIFSPATREEKIAACPEHGHAPYNEATIRAESE